MNADSFFAQGASHTVCQDHAAVRETNRFLMAVVCDGCSSSPMSEVGATILPYTFMEAWDDTHKWAYEQSEKDTHVIDIVFKANLRNKLMEIQRHTSLPDNAFDATVVAAIVDKVRNVINFFIWGDGFIYISPMEGKPTLHTANYASNAPYYFSYGLGQATRVEAYKKEFGDTEADLTTATGDESITRKISEYYSFSIPTEGVKHISLFSDGLASFVNASEEGAPFTPESLLDKVAEYKMTNGNFVSRRLTRFLKEAKKDGITHYDDFSSASIIL